jgi:hypothetical protein
MGLPIKLVEFNILLLQVFSFPNCLFAYVNSLDRFGFHVGPYLIVL